MGTAIALALDAAAGRILPAEYFLVFTSDIRSSTLTHLAIVSFVTFLCGLMKLMSNFPLSLNVLLSCSVLARYIFRVSHTHKLLFFVYTLKVIESFVMIMSFHSIKCYVWILASCVRAISITSLRVKSSRESELGGSMFRSCCRTSRTSQIPAYLGVDGLKLKMPLENLLTRAWFPVLHPSTTIPSKDRAPLAVLTDS